MPQICRCCAGRAVAVACRRGGTTNARTVPGCRGARWRPRPAPRAGQRRRPARSLVLRSSRGSRGCAPGLRTRGAPGRSGRGSGPCPRRVPRLAGPPRAPGQCVCSRSGPVASAPGPAGRQPVPDLLCSGGQPSMPGIVAEKNCSSVQWPSRAPPTKTEVRR